MDINSGDRDQVLLKIIEEDNLDHGNSHLGGIDSSDRTQKYWSEQYDNDRGYKYWSSYQSIGFCEDKISLVLAPMWGTVFPPYNLARLAGVLRHYGYEVTVYDTNIDCYAKVKGTENDDLWKSQSYYQWDGYARFSKHVLPIIKDELDSVCQNILKDKSDIVGFTIYQTNIYASFYIMKQIKKINPNIFIVTGGPGVFEDWFAELGENRDLEGEDVSGLIDYRVVGEGEQQILTLLENYRTWGRPASTKTLGNRQSRLNLNKLPFPDYSDYNLSLYDQSNGTSIETSRGCVAQCAFCSETWFWKYRWRETNRVVEEIKYQIGKYNIRRFWFIDSLCNGNIKEFKNLVETIVKEKLNIRWNSYARCDGRMDLEFMQKIADSGCVALSFGVETGSDKVLSDMKKKIKIWEVYSNIRDGARVELKNHINWMVGFPTEHTDDFLQSLQVLHNIRNWAYAISPGYVCGDAAFSDLQNNWRKYGITYDKKLGDNYFLNWWFTDNYKNTILHRFIRLKLLGIWLMLSEEYCEGVMQNAQRRPNLKNMYKLDFLDDVSTFNNWSDRRNNQNLDYFSGDDEVSQLSASLANEWIGFGWLMYMIFGNFKMTIYTKPELDLEEFGDKVYAGPFWCETSYHIVDDLYFFKCKLKFNHTATRKQQWVDFSKELNRKDMSFDTIEYSFKRKLDYFNGQIIEDHETEFGTWFPNKQQKLKWGKDYYKGNHERKTIIGNQEQVIEL